MARERLRIATYNVHRCIGRDGVYDVGRIAAVLRELDADAIALQEVSYRAPPGHDQLRTLADSAGYASVSFPNHSDDRSQLGLGVLSRRPLEVERKLDLSYGSYESRGALIVRLAVDDSNVTLVNTHLGLRWRERRHQGHAIAAALRELDAGDCVLAGDFNEWVPGAPNLHALRRLLDAPPPRTPPTFPSGRPLLSTDRIWPSTAFRVQSLHAHRTTLSRIASDHLPLSATLQRCCAV